MGECQESPPSTPPDPSSFFSFSSLPLNLSDEAGLSRFWAPTRIQSRFSSRHGCSAAGPGWASRSQAWQGGWEQANVGPLWTTPFRTFSVGAVTRRPGLASGGWALGWALGWAGLGWVQCPLVCACKCVSACVSERDQGAGEIRYSSEGLSMVPTRASAGIDPSI